MNQFEELMSCDWTFTDLLDCRENTVVYHQLQGMHTFTSHDVSLIVLLVDATGKCRYIMLTLLPIFVYVIPLGLRAICNTMQFNVGFKGIDMLNL